MSCPVTPSNLSAVRIRRTIKVANRVVKKNLKEQASPPFQAELHDLLLLLTVKSNYGRVYQYE